MEYTMVQVFRWYPHWDKIHFHRIGTSHSSPTSKCHVTWKNSLRQFWIYHRSSLINYGWQKNAIFQDCYKNIMRLSHDESHLSEGTMSPQNSILNEFNGFLDRYLENMMQQHCFGRWIKESIPYGLESSNTTAVQLLAKTIVAKLDNEEYLPNKDGGTSPKNQVHEELLYPNFVSFLFYQCRNA